MYKVTPHKRNFVHYGAIKTLLMEILKVYKVTPKPGQHCTLRNVNFLIILEVGFRNKQSFLQVRTEGAKLSQKNFCQAVALESYNTIKAKTVQSYPV